MQGQRVQINRITNSEYYPEVKDPCPVQLPDSTWLIYASVGRSENPHEWILGRFTAENLAGPLQEIEPADIEGLQGPQMCAPAVRLEMRDGKPFYKMYMQTTVLDEGGIIAELHSEDGRHFRALAEPVVSRDSFPTDHMPTVVGCYDADVSEVTIDGRQYECLPFTGLRWIKIYHDHCRASGDLYVTLRECNDPDAKWTTPVLHLPQEAVPFHNDMHHENFEWGLEAARILQLDTDVYLTIKACFLEGERHEIGSRQRVAISCSDSPLKQAIAMRPLVEPDEPGGETGHAGVVDLGDRLGVLYQQRAAERQPWHLGYCEVDKTALIQEAQEALQKESRLAAPSIDGLRAKWRQANYTQRKAEPENKGNILRSFIGGGFETGTQINRNGERIDMAEQSGHMAHLAEDYALLRSLNIHTVRDNARWHLIDKGNGEYDFSAIDPILDEAKKQGMQLILTLFHYGFPDDCDPFSDGFPTRFADYCRAVAIRVAGKSDETPVYSLINEMSFLAWAGGDLGHDHDFSMYPFAEQRGGELKRQLVKAAIAGMDAIRQVDSRARFMAIDPMINVTAPSDNPDLADAAAGHHEAQFEV